MLTSEERGDILAGRFKLECPQLIITGPGSTKREGSGALFVSPDGTLGFTIVVPRPEPFRTPFVLAGGSEVLTLSAIDLLGREWTGLGVRLTVLPSPEAGSETGRLWKLSCFSSVEWHRPLMRLVVPTDIQLPTQIWQFGFERALLTFSHLPGGIEVVVDSEEPIPRGLDSRIEEAMWFVFGEVESSAVVEEFRDQLVVTTLLRPIGSQKGGRRPLLGSMPRYSSDLADAFTRYLEYAATGPAEEYHPTSAGLRMVQSSIASTLEEGALLVSVVIEAFISREYPDAGAPDEDVAAELKQVQAHLAVWEGKTDAINRVLGCVKRVLLPNPRSALKELAVRGPLSSRHYEAWVKTRNSLVHGRRSGDNRALLQRTILLQQALSFLVLDRIGYVGKVIDWAQESHPVIPFPPLYGTDIAH